MQKTYVFTELRHTVASQLAAALACFKHSELKCRVSVLLRDVQLTIQLLHHVPGLFVIEPNSRSLDLPSHNPLV